MKKYELTQNSIEIDNRTLYQIKALKDFSLIKKGDLGGYIEYEKNLSHDGNCWISGNAHVYENALVSGNTWVYGNARVFRNARVFDDAWIYDNAHVFGNAKVSGYVLVSENASVYGKAEVSGNARVSGNAWVSENARVSGDTHIFENAHVYGDAHLGNVPVNFNCDFDTYKTLKEILNCPKILPVLSGLNKNLDKLISTILTKTDT